MSTQMANAVAQPSCIYPLVSVVIPCFNQEKYLTESLESVFSQTYPRIEIIVIDDGSTDATSSIAASYGNRICLIVQSNKGLSAARNVGLAACSGKYIQYLDGDDLIEPEKIALQVAFLEEHCDVGIVYSDVRYFTDDHPNDREFGPYVLIPGQAWTPMLWNAPGTMIEKLIHRNLLVVNSALVRLGTVDSVGLWNEQLCAVEDWEYWIRCADADIRFAYADLPNTLSLVRLHAGSMTTQTDRINLAQFQIALHLASKLRNRSAIEINWRRGIWWAAKLGSKGRTGRFWDLFRASPQLRTKLHIFGAFAVGLHWVDHPIRRLLRDLTERIRALWHTRHKFWMNQK